MKKSSAISVLDEFNKVTCFKGRTPETASEQMKDAFSKVSDFDQSGIYLTHYAGFSEWERHAAGDELVQVIEGETTLVLLSGDTEVRNELKSGELLVVPKGVWHRFESPKGIKVLTITPSPTEHSIHRPL